MNGFLRSLVILLAFPTILLAADQAFLDPNKPVEVQKLLSQSRGQTVILERLLKSGKTTISGASTNSCSGSSSCCCKAGAYGACMSPSECSNVGTCVGSAPGC